MTTNNSVNVGLSGATGTGNFVGSTSPSITTAINDTNGNTWIQQTATASSVNFVNVQNNSTTNKPIILGTGSDTNVLLSLQNKGNSGVEIQGTTAGGSATAGFVGEVISSVLLVGSAVSLSTGAAKTVTSISLTAGDWDIWGEVWLSVNGSTTLSELIASVNTTTNAIPTVPATNTSYYQLFGLTTGAGANNVFPAPMCTASVSSTTSYFLVTQVNFAVSTASAYGKIMARRRR